VQRESLGTGVLHPERNRDWISRLIVPAASGLDRHRKMRSADDCPDDPLDQVHIAKTARPAVPLYHLLHRTSEVDVNEFRLIVLSDQSSCLCHGIRIGTIDLNTDRAFHRLELGALESRSDAATDSL
jgi:hypothetical protein